MEESKELERKKLLFNLLDAVKQCQLKFNGKSLLATDKDINITLLCTSFENVFQHGLRKSTQSSLKQFTDVTGLSKLTSILLPTDQKSSFWGVLQKHLSQHELERFKNLKNIKTDLGRTRAWFRSTLNEHSLEKYMHSIINQASIIQSKYENWSFMLDDEKAVTLPNLAAGLSSILFGLSIDKSELDEKMNTSNEVFEQVQAVGNIRINSNVRTKHKKRQAKVINFDGDADCSNHRADSPFEWKFNPDDEFGLTCKASRSARRNLAEDVISPNIPSDSSGIQNSDTFSFEYDQLSYTLPSNKLIEENCVPLSKSESNLKDVGNAKAGRLSRLGSLFKHDDQKSTNSDDFMRPVDVDGRIIDIGVFKLVDPETTSESYGSFDSQELVDIEAIRQQLQDQGNIQNNEDLGDEVIASQNHSCVRTDPHKEIPIHSVPINNSLQAEIMSKGTDEEIKFELKRSADEHLKEKLKSLEKENSLLKDQLKNYIDAVKISELRNNDASNKELNSDEAKEYEQKLVQVAEMHAELVEFNSVILRKLSQKEIQLEQTMKELSRLSRSHRGVTSGLSQSSINIIIPSAFLHGSPPNSYHVYQIYIRIRNDEWNVYRRYTEFYELHCKLKKALKNIKNLNFPPKKAFGRKDPKLVEERRRKLEDYLRRIIGIITEKSPQLLANPSRRTFMAIIPFFDNEVRLWDNSGQSTLRLHLSNDAPNQSYSGL